MNSKLPANPSTDLIAAFEQGTPMQRLLGSTLERLGGLDFVEEWAEQNPSEFMRMLMAASPQPAGGGSSQTINLNMHPALAPGELDRGATYDHD